MAGEAKTSAINEMQTLRTHSNESWTCIAWSAERGFNIRLQAGDSDRPRLAVGCTKLAQLVESPMGWPTYVRPVAAIAAPVGTQAPFTAKK